MKLEWTGKDLLDAQWPQEAWQPCRPPQPPPNPSLFHRWHKRSWSVLWASKDLAWNNALYHGRYPNLTTNLDYTSPLGFVNGRGIWEEIGVMDLIPTFSQVDYSEVWLSNKQPQLYFAWMFLISWANKLWLSVSLVPRLPFYQNSQLASDFVKATAGRYKHRWWEPQAVWIYQQCSHYSLQRNAQKYKTNANEASRWNF